MDPGDPVTSPPTVLPPQHPRTVGKGWLNHPQFNTLLATSLRDEINDIMCTRTTRRARAVRVVLGARFLCTRGQFPRRSLLITLYAGGRLTNPKCPIRARTVFRAHPGGKIVISCTHAHLNLVFGKTKGFGEGGKGNHTGFSVESKPKPRNHFGSRGSRHTPPLQFSEGYATARDVKP